MTVFPIIQFLSVLLNLTNGLNETNGLTQLQGSSSLSADLAHSEIQPYPLGHPSPVGDEVTLPKSEGSNVFPYLMSRPVFTETVKSSSQEASGKSAKAKQLSSGWKQDDDSRWFKHGGEEELDKERSTKGQSSYQNGSHKKSLGHDNRDSKEKWKKGSESGEHENEKLVEEYNKNKGRMYEKKWSWEKERGSSHGWENAGNNDQSHSKGLFDKEYNSELKFNEGKEGSLGGKKKSHAETDSWAGKHIDKGLRSEDKDSKQKDANSMKQWDEHYRRKFGYL